MVEPSGGFTRLRVFVASSSDLNTEREIVRAVLNELNRTLEVLTPERRVFLEFVGWETHAYPAPGRPQGVINDQIGPYDILIGIMWRRFGIPTGEAASGTEEEFEIAYGAWERRQRPHIMFYFSTAPAPPPTTIEEVEQLRRVVEFRQRLEKVGLIWKYDGPTKFADVVRPHLMNVIAEITAAHASEEGPPKVPARRTAPGKRSAPSASPPPGQSVKITAIAVDDAYYAMRERLIGRTGRIRSMQATGAGWYGGLIELDHPLTEDLAVVPLFRFKWQA